MGTKLNKVPSNEAELNKLLQDIYLRWNAVCGESRTHGVKEGKRTPNR